MAILTSLISVLLALTTVVTAISLPATIEIDLLFPRNSTYNTQYMTNPVIFAIQNAQAAYSLGWEIRWKIYGASSSNYIFGNSEYNLPESYIPNPFPENPFLYYFDDVAIVPITEEFVTLSGEGEYRLEWEYLTKPCREEAAGMVQTARTVVAKGTEYFTLVEDGSGEDFDVVLEECPGYGGSWVVESVPVSGCPVLGDGSGEGDPCKVQLDEDQVECIKDWMEGKNETATCRGAFETVSESWIEDAEFADDGDDDSDTSTSDDDEDEDADDDEARDFAISHRPSVFGLAVAMLVAVAMAL